MPKRKLIAWCVLALLAARCSRNTASNSTDAGSGNDNSDDANQPGLAFSNVPAAPNVNALFQVWCRINDANGVMTDDSDTTVTISASGSGTLRGTLTRRASNGQVIFDDLIYDRWESITLTVSAPALGQTTTRTTIPVRPLMRFVTMPPSHVPAGQAVGPFDIELVDGLGHPVTADQTVTLDSGASVQADGGPQRTFSTGKVEYAQIVMQAAGAQTLVWHSQGLADLLHPVTVHDGDDTESLWLPSGRVGADYRATFPATADEFHVLDDDALPRGLILEPTGELHGTPTTAGHVQLQVFATSSGQSSVLYRADLSIFPATETASTTLDALDVDGPFTVGSLDDMVTVASRQTSVRVRIFFPAAAAAPDAGMPPPAGGVADGVFPLIVFHHGAVMLGPDHPTVYDRYDQLLKRWTSYGFVVATIDAPDLVWVDGRLVSASLANLNAMSENQRATIAYFKTKVTDPSFPLAGHVDVDRVIVAGHSRGGGASIITARAEPSVVGGILLKPLDPMGTVGGENVWNVPLPSKPFLVIVAGNDGDVPYPLVDFLYERRAGPMVAATILGSLHYWTCDASCPPEAGVSPGIPREQDWAVTNAFATAFLAYAARGDLSYAPLLFGLEGLSNHLSTMGTLVRSDRAASSLLVDDFQENTAGRNRLGLPALDSQMAWSADEPSLITAVRGLSDGYDFYRDLYEQSANLSLSDAHRLQWAVDQASYSTTLGGLDVSGRAVFQFRARTDDVTLPGDQWSVRFRDSEGGVGLVPGTGHLGQVGLGSRFSDVIIPTAEIKAAGVDLQQLETAEIVFNGAGTLLIDDLRFE